MYKKTKSVFKTKPNQVISLITVAIKKEKKIQAKQVKG